MRRLSSPNPKPGRKQKPSRFNQRASCWGLSFLPSDTSSRVSARLRPNEIGHDSFLIPSCDSKSVAKEVGLPDLFPTERLNVVQIEDLAASKASSASCVAP